MPVTSTRPPGSDGVIGNADNPVSLVMGLRSPLCDVPAARAKSKSRPGAASKSDEDLRLYSERAGNANVWAPAAGE
jgi:hypothetical protein